MGATELFERHHWCLPCVVQPSFRLEDWQWQGNPSDQILVEHAYTLWHAMTLPTVMPCPKQCGFQATNRSVAWLTS